MGIFDENGYRSEKPGFELYENRISKFVPDGAGFQMKKALIPWIVLVIFEAMGLIALVVSNFNSIFAGVYCAILCILSSIAIIRMDEVTTRFKTGLALGFPFKYFVFSAFIFAMPLFGTSKIPIFIFTGLLLASIIGTPIVLRYAVKQQSET